MFVCMCDVIFQPMHMICDKEPSRASWCENTAVFVCKGKLSVCVRERDRETE